MDSGSESESSQDLSPIKVTRPGRAVRERRLPAKLRDQEEDYLLEVRGDQRRELLDLHACIIICMYV